MMATKLSTVKSYKGRVILKLYLKFKTVILETLMATNTSTSNF